MTSDQVFGPYQREAETRDSPLLREIDRLYRTGRYGQRVRDIVIRHLLATCNHAGVDLGDLDRHVLEWLAGWEPETIQVIVGIVSRAYAAGQASTPTPERSECRHCGKPIELGTVNGIPTWMHVSLVQEFLHRDSRHAATPTSARLLRSSGGLPMLAIRLEAAGFADAAAFLSDFLAGKLDAPAATPEPSECRNCGRPVELQEFNGEPDWGHVGGDFRCLPYGSGVAEPREVPNAE